MSHPDPELLALLALGEPAASASERAHLASCPTCAAEVAEMRHAAEVARSTIDETELEEPPAEVWDRIRLDLGLGDPRGEGAVAVLASPALVAEATPAPSPPRSSRPFRASWVLALSTVLLGVAAAAVWLAIPSPVTAPPVVPVPVATAALAPFPTHPGANGHAEVDEAEDGTRTLTVALEGDTDADGDREVWLIRDEGDGGGASLISLGALEGSTGTFALPADVDLARFDLVDISLEPIDGDPGHSGDSIVRGQLT